MTPFIISGEVKIYAMGSTFKTEIQEGEFLKIQDPKSNIVEVKREGKVFRINFEGTASSISAGPGVIVKNLSPTYLEIIYNHQPLGTIWSSIGFLWALIWGIRKVLSEL